LLGKILKDEDKLETHHIQTGDSLHLVVKKKPTDAPKPEQPAASANPTAEAMGSGGMGGFGMGFPAAGMGGMNMSGLGMMNEEMMQNEMQTVSYE
jgi:hypothetical protein